MLRPATLIDALVQAPADKPFITFWIDEDERESVTFGEFREHVGGMARALGEHGIRSGDRVVVLMPQGVAAMTTFVAAMMVGAVPACLAYPNLKVEPSKYRSGLAGLSANLGAKAIVIDEEFPEEMMASVAIGDEAMLLVAGKHGFRALREPRDLHNGAANEAMWKISPDAVAFIQHSAGTTGLQKGVALGHDAVLRQIEHLAKALKIDSRQDRIYSWLPLYHDMGLIACFMLPMVCHIPVVMQSPIDWVMRPQTLLQVISECKCTLAWMPNFAFQFVPRRTPESRWHDYDLSSVRLLINCSEPVRASSMREFQRAFGIDAAVLQSSYAMAENVFAVTQSDIDRPSGPATIWVDGQQFRAAHRVAVVEEGTPGAMSFVSSGRLLADQQIRIVSEAGADLENDSVGEILVRGDCLFDGYYNRPDLTAEAMVDGWYRTGDLGFYLDGELYVVGRKKDLLIIGGENIYPQDIEEIVGEHPSVHDGRVIAMGVYNSDLGTEEVVVVAEVEHEKLLESTVELEQEIRSRVVANLGIALRSIFLKPPKWIVKSTAGKAARSTTRGKLLQEHPELNAGA